MAFSPSFATVELHCKGILFDMDGILISSLGSVERSWTTWARMRGIDPEHAMSIIHGRRAIESITSLRPDLDSHAELQILEDLEIADNEGLRILPGVADLLASLPKDRWTVVTSATERLARVRLAAGGILVPEHFVNADTVTEGKPHPAPYLAGAAILGLAPQDCVVFEDSTSGVTAGRAAGCTVIATTFSHSIESLAAASYLIHDLASIRVTDQPSSNDLILAFTPIPLPV